MEQNAEKIREEIINQLSLDNIDSYGNIISFSGQKKLISITLELSIFKYLIVGIQVSLNYDKEVSIMIRDIQGLIEVRDLTKLLQSLEKVKGNIKQHLF